MLFIIYIWFIKKEFFFFCCLYVSFNCDFNNIKYIDFIIDFCNIIFYVFNFMYIVWFDLIVVLFIDEVFLVCRSEYGMVNFLFNMLYIYVYIIFLLLYFRYVLNKCSDV